MSDTQLADIGLRRLGLLVCSPDAKVTPSYIGAYLAEAAKLGVNLSNIDALTDDALARWPHVRAQITALRGGNKRYAPLFAGFPEKLPEFDDARTRFTLAGVRLLSLGRGVWPLDGGTPFTADELRWAMDFSDIKWWPASSVPQDIDTTRQAKAYQEMLPSDSRIEWMNMRVVTPEGLREALEAFMADCAYSPASLREEVRSDLATLIELLGTARIDMEQVRFNETRALFIAGLFTRASTSDNDRAQLVASGLSPDDLLRLFATITDGDASLHEKLRVPALRRAQRKLVLACLEASPRLRDVFRRRGLWLTIAKSLHVGEYTDKFPQAARVFKDLRESRRDSESLLSRSERELSEGHVVEAAKLLADEAPSILVRQLRRYASLAAGNVAAQDGLLAAVSSSSAKVPLRVLLAARAQMLDNGETYPRLAITKAGDAMAIMRESGHLAVDDAFAQALVVRLESAIKEACAAKGSWAGERIWIAPETAGLLVPDQLRATSDGLLALDRGSRLALGDAKVLRLFVYWRENDGTRSDLDLSCVALDESFKQVGHVSWTNLADGSMTHSGDLTSAPDGAAEFIDIRLDSLGGRGWRYLAPSIYRYSGPAFGALAEATAGWMLRDKCSSDYKTFDVATVANAFALTGGKGTARPFVYDIVTNEIIYFDAYLQSGHGARVERNVATTELLGETLSQRWKLRPSIAELVGLHMQARGGELVEARDEATITVGIDDGATYNALRPTALLADLL